MSTLELREMKRAGTLDAPTLALLAIAEAIEDLEVKVVVDTDTIVQAIQQVGEDVVRAIGELECQT